MPWLLTSLRTRVAAIASETKGSVNILFAFSLIPLLGLIGLGVDYGVAQSVKNKLDNAADSSAIAAVATAKAYVAANPTDPNLTADAIAAGQDRASRAFVINAGSLAYSQVPTPTITLTRTNQTFASTVTYATTTQNNFGRLFGVTFMNIAGTAAASADIPSYLDFYLLVDVSGSMGLPSTSAGETALAAINTQSPDPFPGTTQGCEFACHFPGYHGWTLAKANNIELRSHAVNTAVCGLLNQAATPVVTNQYRVGLYPFATMMGTLAPLSSTLSNAYNLATCDTSKPNPLTAFDNLLDTGTTQEYTGNDPSTGTGSGGTHFDAVLPAINTVISQGAGFGNGSASNNSRPFVFLITDGMQNPQHYGAYQNNVWNYPGYPSTFKNYNSAGFDGSTPQAIDPSQCTALKNAGATISILYIPYTPISSTVDPYGEIQKSNAAIPSLPSALTSCASTGFFYTANSPADITSALNNMFYQAIQVAHLSK